MVRCHMFCRFGSGGSPISIASWLHGKNASVCFGNMAFSLSSILPQLPAVFSIPIQYDTNEDFSSFVEEQEISAAQESVERLAGVELSKMGISSKNIHADMDKQEDGSIGIIRIEIMLASGYEGYGARVESELSEILGVPVEVIAGEKR